MGECGSGRVGVGVGLISAKWTWIRVGMGDAHPKMSNESHRGSGAGRRNRI